MTKFFIKNNGEIFNCTYKSYTFSFFSTKEFAQLAIDYFKLKDAKIEIFK